MAEQSRDATVVDDGQMHNYYNLLRVSKNPDLKTLRANHKQLTRASRGITENVKGAKLELLQKAFDTLSRADLRKDYDVQYAAFMEKALIPNTCALQTPESVMFPQDMTESVMFPQDMSLMEVDETAQQSARPLTSARTWAMQSAMNPQPQQMIPLHEPYQIRPFLQRQHDIRRISSPWPSPAPSVGPYGSRLSIPHTSEPVFYSASPRTMNLLGPALSEQELAELGFVYQPVEELSLATLDSLEPSITQLSMNLSAPEPCNLCRWSPKSFLIDLRYRLQSYSLEMKLKANNSSTLLHQCDIQNSQDIVGASGIVTANDLCKDWEATFREANGALVTRSKIDAALREMPWVQSVPPFTPPVWLFEQPFHLGARPWWSAEFDQLFPEQPDGTRFTNFNMGRPCPLGLDCHSCWQRVTDMGSTS